MRDALRVIGHPAITCHVSRITLNMIRPFDLRDLALVSQIEHQGTPLYAELALTRHPRPLQSALAGFFSLNGRGMRTYILREDSEAVRPNGLLQMRQRGDGQHGVIAYVAPSLDDDPSRVDTWGRLLDYAASQAGRRRRVWRQPSASTATCVTDSTAMPKAAAVATPRSPR